MRHHLNGFGRKYSQRGAAALPVGVLLLFIAALVLIAVSRTTLMEQRISGNEIRVRQALQAGQAGISHAMAYMKAGGIDRVSPTDQADPITPLTLPTGASYQVYYCDPIDPSPDPPKPYPRVEACESLTDRSSCEDGFKSTDRFGLPLVLACGRSDDNIALQPVVVSFSRATTMTDSPDNPLISKGTLNVQGSATVTNYFNNLTIWTGGPTESIGNAGKTFIRNPNIPQPEMTESPPSDIPTSCKANASYICVTDKTAKGPDVIDQDLTLKNMPDEDIFRNYFGHDFETYRDEVATRVITAAQASSLATQGGEAIVITGSTASVSLPNSTIGSTDNPVVLIIEGDWGQGGNTTVYGVVYVMGDVDVSGNVIVYGNVSVEGEVAGTGSLDIIYDPFANSDGSNKLQKLGKPGMLSGSWRDWL